MSTIPTGRYRPDPSPTRWLQLTIDVAGVAPEKVAELEAKLNEYKQQLTNDPVSDGSRIYVKRI